MFSELSVLIPVYNIDAVPLVLALHRQAQAVLIRFEIRVYDDASTNEELKKKNREALSELPHVVYKELPENQGRSRIRNLLAEEATYSTLLFIDADSELPDNSYLKTYRNYDSSPPVMAGGTIYSLHKPAPEQMLRWTYGHKREARPAGKRNQNPYQSFTLNNLLIDKKVYLQNRLDEEIRTYGHEDTVFGQQLFEKNVKVVHIDNPVRHTGLETADVFLGKTAQAVENLYTLYHKDGTGSETSLVKMFEKVKATGMCGLLVNSFGLLKGQALANLKSTSPNLRLFDLYKLYLMCRLEVKEGRSQAGSSKK